MRCSTSAVVAVPRQTHHKMDVAAERVAREKSLAKAHQEYLDDHPEIRQLLNDFISTALVEQPVDVFEFAREHFKGTATEVDETAELEQQQEGSEGAGGDDVDAADLDELDALADASASTDLRAYLKQVFESIDANGDGEISAAELKVKLDSDNELQVIIESAGGDGNWHVMEQLDENGDGTISWMEFEQMLGDP